jgi:hypothetical protein
MLKRVSVLFFVSLFVSTAFFAQAQDNTPIEYGETVEGEITDDAYEVGYSFSGTAGDVVVIEMRRANTDSGLYNAAVVLLDPSGSTLADSTDYFAYEGAQALVAAELPEDGDYTILATRDDGRTGDEVGEYVIKLFQPDILSEEPIQAEMNNETQDQYYVIQSEGSFEFTYTVSSATYAPLVDVNLVTEDGYPETAASLSGLRLDSGTVKVFAEGELYLVAVVADDLDYLFDEDIQISYEVSVTAAE